VTNDVVNADFLATALPNITIVATTNAIPENSSITQYFTLTRTGELTNEFAVNLFLSGSATVTTDFTLRPSLAAGTNTVTFPSNVASLTFAFQTVNDSV